MNVPIEVTVDKCRHQFICDLYWPEYKLDVEYESNAFHATTPQKLKEDAERKNLLGTEGIDVVVITQQIIYNAANMRTHAAIISGYLEKRLRYYDEDYKLKQARLRALALP